MSSTINYTQNSTMKVDSVQLIMNLNYEVLIPENDSVRLLSQIVEEMDLSGLNQVYSLFGRNSAVPPRIMLKIILYAYMEGIYSSRKIEKACHRDLNFKWLLSGYPAPDHNTICRFRKERLTFCLEDIYVQFVRQLHTRGEVKFENLFIDGTKIEANANKYTFVWRKSADKYHARLIAKIPDFLTKINNVFNTTFSLQSEDKALTILRQVHTCLLRLIELENPTFVHGKGQRKTDLQKFFEECEELIKKKEIYDQYFELLGNRNNFCKTDSDATFLHMKDDHMRNAQLKPGYNMQIAVEGGYIIACEAYPNANDLWTLKPFLEKIKGMYRCTVENVVCDAGYESEENYAYLEQNHQNAYIKPASYDRWKKHSYKHDISKLENMDFDEMENCYICNQGKKLKFVRTSKTHKGKSDYEVLQSIYECESCEGCPVKSKCTKAQGNRRISVSREFLRLRQQSHLNITSEKGIRLRVNRSIQAEGAFGSLKEDMEFRRFLSRGKPNIMVEFQLLCLGFNINKLHRKIQSGKRGTILYDVPSQAA